MNQFALLVNGDLSLGQDLLFGGRYVAVLFNSKYYGVVLVNRFFDSPVLSCTAFGAGVVVAFNAFKLLLTEKPEEAEEEEEERTD